MKQNKRHIGRRTLSIFKQIILILVTLVLLALQLITLYYVIFTASKIKWLYFFVYLLGYICVIDLIGKDMVGSFKLIWIIIILIFPFVGTIFFITCGDGRTFPTRKIRKIKAYLKNYMVHDQDLTTEIELDDTASKHISILHNGCKLYPSSNTRLRYYKNIDNKFHDMLEDIAKAKKFIFIEYFIISSGIMLNRLIEALDKASNRGVEIKIIYDDFGSKTTLKHDDLKKLQTIKNLKINKFAPFGLTLNITINYRDHRKMIVIDGEIGYVGGDNIADEYANYITRFGYWRDNAIRLEGKAVDNLVYMFSETWFLSTKEMLNIEKYRSNQDIESNNIVFTYSDGPTDDLNPAADLYLSIIQNAKKYIYISTPYFIIDQEFINNLVMASKSGVDVRILIPGIPDKKTVFLLTQSHFGKLLREGVKIYKYTPGFNHAKNMICDDKYATIGSVNIDYRSLYLHFENGVYVYDDKIISELKNDFENDLNISEEISYDAWKKRKWYVKVIGFILKLFSTLM